MIILTLIMFLFITSCFPLPQEPPLGVWKSEEPEIIMYFKPEYRNLPTGLGWYNHLGKYFAEDYELNVIIMPHAATRIRIIYDIELASSGGMTHATFLIGDWRLRRGQLHLTPTPFYQERLGVNVIIFNKIEDYPALDPTEWITDNIEKLIEFQKLLEEERQQRLQD